MSQDIRIPDIGDTDDVEVVEILVAAGDEVGEDDPIIVIESDKASMEVPSSASGTIEEVTVAVGDKVAEGQVIARLKATEGGEAPASDDDAATDQDDATDATAPADGESSASSDAEAAGRQASSRGREPADADDETAPEKEDAAASEEASSREEAASSEEEVDVKVPDIGEAENVEVIEVAVKPGDTVDVDDMLVVVESDKASMEIPSTHAGTVKDVHVSVGTQVDEGTRLVTLVAKVAAGGASGQAARAEDRQADQSQPARREPEPEPQRESSAPERRPSAPAAEPPAPGSSGASVYAGPAVRRLARELGVNLQEVEGTGNRGRIVKDDVKAHVKRRMATPAEAGGGALPAMPAVDFSRFGETEEQPLSKIRARGAENLHRSWLNLPHVTQHDEVDVTDLEDFRASLKAEGEQHGVKVTPLAFIIKACCQVLKEFPTFNASLDPSAKTFILKRYYNIGMAVDTPDGLVVPVIRDADRKGVWELSAEVAELAEKAREKKLGMHDMQGGSFSVSSLGAIGGTGFTPIINAPEVAILGVSRLTVRPVWRDEAFVPRKMLPLSLSYDHRAINGAEAGRFVARLGQLLNDVRRLAL